MKYGQDHWVWRSLPRLVAIVTAMVAGVGLPEGAAETERCRFVDPAQEPGSRVVAEERDGLVFDVVLPAGYDGNAETRYPALYVLHAGGDEPEDCKAKVEEIRSAKSFLNAEETIVVVVRARGRGVASEWWYGPPWPTSTILRLIPYVDAKYRTVQERSYKIDPGLSLGSFVAAVLPRR